MTEDVPVCRCGEPLVWLMGEGRASEQLAQQLWRCVKCERFCWRLVHPWDAVPPVGALFARIRELSADAAKDAYSVPGGDV